MDKPVKKRARELPGADKPAKDFVDSSEEEDLDEPNDYQLDDFVVDNAEEEEEGNENRQRTSGDDGEDNNNDGEHDGKKRRKRKARNLELDEDDRALIEEAQGGTRERNGAAKKGSRLKRLRKKPKMGAAGESAGDVPDADRFSKSLFGEDAPATRKPMDDGSGDELSDFIVDYDEATGQEVPHRKPRKLGASRITETQLEEATSIFGDLSDFPVAGSRDDDGEYNEGEEEEEDIRSLRESSSAARIDKEQNAENLLEQFEPSILVENFITPADEKIKSTDVPERLQLRATHEALPQVEGVLNKEAEWIFARVFASLDDFKNKEMLVVPQIIAVLEFLHKENLEVPFIALYRKDYTTEFAGDSKHLWTIYDWDEKFIHLLTRKSNLRQLYSQFPSISEEYIRLLEQSQTDVEVRDLHDHFQLHYSTELEAPSGQKRPVKRNYYNICKKEGIVEFANKHFGMTAEQFGDNLINDIQLKEPEKVDYEPEVAANAWISANAVGGFRTVHHVLKGARHVLAKEMAHDPRVRHSLRNTFYVRAYVSTNPTQKGEGVITADHIYANVKRLRKKPIHKFIDTQFITIEKAEREGMITVTIEIPPAEHESDFVGEMEHLYLSSGHDAVTAKWNEERKQILQDALSGHLYPLFANELRHRLREEAEERVIADSIRKLRYNLMRRPWRKPKAARSRGNRDKRDSIKVMACTWGMGASMSFCVVVDKDGEYAAELKLPFMNCRADEYASENDRRRKEDDLSKIRHFIINNKPDVVVLGAAVGESDARRFFDDIRKTVREVNDKIHVTVADAQVPRIYSTTDRAVREFPDKPPLLRQTICLARMLQDPLNEYAALCEKDSILCLRLHPLQDVVKDQLLVQIHRCFIDVVSKVGVDINKVILHKESQYPLQFVAGLGPRKALGLLQAITRKGGMLTSREDIDQILQPPLDAMVESSTVYTNAIGFLRIRQKWFSKNSDQQPESLDDTRVHPDDYAFACKMTADALESNEEEDQWRYLVADLMEDPKREKKLTEIDLESFAEEWERAGKGKKLKTLYDIKWELIHPFKEIRAKYKDPSEEEIFTMLTGETQDTLYQGLLISATVISVSPSKVVCRLENGLTGVIESTCVSDQNISIPEVIMTGSCLQCRVLSVDTTKFLVTLSSRGSDLRDTHLSRHKEVDPYLSQDEEVRVPRRQEERRSASMQKTVLQRRVEHPLFRQFTCKDAEEHLNKMEFSDEAIVIRPSSKGLDHLTISWKFTDSVIIHTDIQEKDKQTPLHLGRRLIVAGKQFEDLDEILYRHLNPMLQYSREVQRHRHYFASSGKDAVVAHLRNEKAKHPQIIPYAMTAAVDLPGKFMLSFLPVNSVRHEFISVSPEGLRLRGREYKTIDHLIVRFKESFTQRRQQHQRESRYDQGGLEWD